MIEELVQLGQKLAQNFELEDFPNQALNELQNLPSFGDLDSIEREVEKWLQDESSIPSQVNIYNDFGEPSLSIFHNEVISIDLYFWRKNDTLIHSHAFRGAFKVLAGLSLQEVFEIKVSRELKKDLLLSEINLKKRELLRPGDTRIIPPSMDLVHRVLHLENPTLTLCLRTVNDKSLSQWHHLSTGLSYEQRNLTPLHVKAALYFQYLFVSSPDRAEAFFENRLRQFDSSSRISIYESLFKNELGLEVEISEVLMDRIRSVFLEQPWFETYESHFEALHNQLNESFAESPPTKLLAHLINSGVEPVEIDQILREVTKLPIDEIINELLETPQVLDPEDPTQQMRKIESLRASLHNTES